MWNVKTIAIIMLFLLNTVFVSTANCKLKSITVDWSLYDKDGVIRYDLYYSYTPNMEQKILACSADNPLVETITCENVDIKDVTYFALAAVKKDGEFYSNIKSFDAPVKIVLDFNSTNK